MRGEYFNWSSRSAEVQPGVLTPAIQRVGAGAEGKSRSSYGGMPLVVEWTCDRLGCEVA